MKNPALVSVFLPTYNHENYIAASLESVLEQDYRNLEIVVCDDASRDRTPEIMREYARKYPELIRPIFNPKNLGITTTCNVVLSHCSGKYIAFSSGDDLFEKTKIRKQVEAMEGDGSIVLSYHDIEVFDSDSGQHLKFWNSGPNSNGPVSGAADRVLRQLVSRGTCFMSALSVMARRDAIPRTGYDVRIPVASDWFMWIEILANAGPNSCVHYIPEVLARYRRHQSAVSTTRPFQDEAVTMAITETRYPWLCNEVRTYRGFFCYSFGADLVRQEKRKMARSWLIYGLRQSLYSWKSVVWLILSVTSLPIPKRLPMARPKPPGSSSEGPPGE